MNRPTFALTSSLFLSLLGGCTSLQSVSLTQVPTDRGHPVRAQVSDSALLGIHFDNEFVDDLTPQLLAQCPHGRLTGLLTKQESSLYVVVVTRRVIASGYCVHDAAPSHSEPDTALSLRTPSEPARAEVR